MISKPGFGAATAVGGDGLASEGLGEVSREVSREVSGEAVGVGLCNRDGVVNGEGNDSGEAAEVLAMGG